MSTVPKTKIIIVNNNLNNYFLLMDLILLNKLNSNNNNNNYPPYNLYKIIQTNSKCPYFIKILNNTPPTNYSNKPNYYNGNNN